MATPKTNRVPQEPAKVDKPDGDGHDPAVIMASRYRTRRRSSGDKGANGKVRPATNKDSTTKSSRKASDALSRKHVSRRKVGVGSKSKPIQRPDILSVDEFIYWREGCPRDYVFDDFRPWLKAQDWLDARMSYDAWMTLYTEYKRIVKTDLTTDE
jgi:hypothetical protein